MVQVGTQASDPSSSPRRVRPRGHPIAPTEFPEERSAAEGFGPDGLRPTATCAPQEEDTLRRSRPETAIGPGLPPIVFRYRSPAANRPQTPSKPAAEATGLPYATKARWSPPPRGVRREPRLNRRLRPAASDETTTISTPKPSCDPPARYSRSIPKARTANAHKSTINSHVTGARRAPAGESAAFQPAPRLGPLQGLNNRAWTPSVHVKRLISPKSLYPPHPRKQPTANDAARDSLRLDAKE